MFIILCMPFFCLLLKPPCNEDNTNSCWIKTVMKSGTMDMYMYIQTDNIVLSGIEQSESESDIEPVQTQAHSHQDTHVQH